MTLAVPHGPARVPILSYAAINMPVAALGLPVATYLPAFFAESVGIPLASVGTAFVIVRCWDVLADPLIGAGIDRSRFAAKHKWWIAGATLPLMLAIWLVFMARPGVGMAYLVGSMALFYSAYSIFEVAHQSWARTLSTDPAILTRLFGWREIAGMSSVILMLVIPALIQTFIPGVSLALRVGAMGAFSLLLLPVVVIAGLWRLPDIAVVEAGRQLGAGEMVSTILRNPDLVRMYMIAALAGIASGTTGSLFLFFATSAVRLGDISSPLLLSYFVAAIFGMALWMRLALRMARTKVMAGMALYAASMHLSFLWLPGGLPVLTFILTAALGLGFASPFLMRAILATLIDEDERRVGVNRTALLFAGLTLTNKLGQTAAVGALFPLLDLVGFRPGSVNDPAALSALRGMFAIVPAAAMLCIALLLMRWRLPVAAVHQ